MNLQKPQLKLDGAEMSDHRRRSKDRPRERGRGREMRGSEGCLVKTSNEDEGARDSGGGLLIITVKRRNFLEPEI